MHYLDLHDFFTLFHTYFTDFNAPAEISPNAACLRLDDRTEAAKAALSTSLYCGMAPKRWPISSKGMSPL